MKLVRPIKISYGTKNVSINLSLHQDPENEIASKWHSYQLHDAMNGYTIELYASVLPWFKYLTHYP